MMLGAILQYECRKYGTMYHISCNDENNIIIFFEIVAVFLSMLCSIETYVRIIKGERIML
jgi:hypothetical protein